VLPGAKRDLADAADPASDVPAQPAKRRVPLVAIAPKESAPAAQATRRAVNDRAAEHRDTGFGAMKVGEFRAALEAFDKGLQEEPGDLDLRAARAQALTELGRAREATLMLDSLLSDLRNLPSGAGARERLLASVQEGLVQARAAVAAPVPAPAASEHAAASKRVPSAPAPAAAMSDVSDAPPSAPSDAPPTLSHQQSIVAQHDPLDAAGEDELDVAALRALSEEERQDLVDSLAEAEAIIDSSLEELEEEVLAERLAEITAELAETKGLPENAPEVVEAAEEELKALREMHQEAYEDSFEESALLQEQLEVAGENVSAIMRLIGKNRRAHTQEGVGMSKCWREEAEALDMEIKLARTRSSEVPAADGDCEHGGDADEEGEAERAAPKKPPEWVRQAEKALDKVRPVKTRQGRKQEMGASGFKGAKLYGMNRDEVYKAITPKDAAGLDVDGADEIDQLESSSGEEDEGAEGGGSRRRRRSEGSIGSGSDSEDEGAFGAHGRPRPTREEVRAAMAEEDRAGLTAELRRRVRKHEASADGKAKREAVHKARCSVCAVPLYSASQFHLHPLLAVPICASCRVGPCGKLFMATDDYCCWHGAFSPEAEEGAGAVPAGAGDQAAGRPLPAADSEARAGEAGGAQSGGDVKMAAADDEGAAPAADATEEEEASSEADSRRLVLCDNVEGCSGAFCVQCLRAHMGSAFADEVLRSESWQCLLCAPPQRLLQMQRFATDAIDRRDQDAANRREKRRGGGGGAGAGRGGGGGGGGASVNDGTLVRLTGPLTGSLKWTGPASISGVLDPSPARASGATRSNQRGEPLVLSGAHLEAAVPPGEPPDRYLPRPHPAFEALLKPHQREALQFIWKAMLGEPLGLGAVLSHSMGLGKTLTTIAFIHTLLSAPRAPRAPGCAPPVAPKAEPGAPCPAEPSPPPTELLVRRVVVATPVAVLHNWQRELQRWTPDDSPVRVWTLESIARKEQRRALFDSWNAPGASGVLLLSHDLFRVVTSKYIKHRDLQAKNAQAAAAAKAMHAGGIAADEEDKLAAKLMAAAKGEDGRSANDLIGGGTLSEADLQGINEALYEADLVVVDEAHKLKNDKTLLSRAFKQVRTRRRLALTGTPVQNNLHEYFVMVDWIRPNSLGTRAEFTQNFADAIERGQHTDSSKQDVAKMRKRAYILHTKLSEFVHRKGYAVLRQGLPPKRELVVVVNLSPLQRRLYRAYCAKVVNAEGTNKQLFRDYQTLLSVWDHPAMLLPPKGAATAAERESCEVDTETASVLQQAGAASASAAAGAGPATAGAAAAPPATAPTPTPAWYESVWPTKDRAGFPTAAVSGKVHLSLCIAAAARSKGEKVLIFSQRTMMLDVFEKILQHTPLPANDTWGVQGGGTTGAAQGGGAGPSLRYWQPDADYLRIDGSVSARRRYEMSQTFNEEDEGPTLLLISTTAGSHGINLQRASRVIVFDASWNPTNDLQAVFRTYRYGQRREVTVYRLLASNTMEEKVYKKQVLKQGMASRVMELRDVERRYTRDEMARVYELDVPAEEDDEDEETLETMLDDPLLQGIIDDPTTQCGRWCKEVRAHDTMVERSGYDEITADEMADAHLEYHRSLHSAPRNARCPKCKLFPVQHTWTRPYLFCPRHPGQPVLLAPAVPEAQDLSPAPNEPNESWATLKFVTELPSASNNSPYCSDPSSKAWYELQIQEDDGPWVAQEKAIKSSIVRKKHLQAGKVYRFRVRIVHNGNPSAWSEESAPLKHGHVLGVSKQAGAGAGQSPAGGGTATANTGAVPAQGQAQAQ